MYNIPSLIREAAQKALNMSNTKEKIWTESDVLHEIQANIASDAFVNFKFCFQFFTFAWSLVAKPSMV